MNLFLDIETLPEGAPDYSGLPDPSSIVVLHDDPDIVPDKRLKDPEKVAADIERKRAALQARRRAEAVKARAKREDDWRKGALDCLDGRVLCVGVAVEDGGPKVLMEDTEEATLARLQAGLERCAGKARGRLRIWTWNGFGFDRGWLARRASRLKLYELSSRTAVGKPWEADDLMLAWQMGNRRQRSKLDDVCAFYGIERTANPIKGSEVLDRYMAGDLDAIRDHCIDDVRVLQLLHREFQLSGWLS